MMRFIVTGDWHFKGMNPKSRLDNFQETMTRKINEVFQIAVQFNANGIIVPGDIMDSASTTIPTMINLGMLLNLAPCKVLTIPGNHDLYAGNPGSKFRTPYGLLTSLGFITDVSETFADSFFPLENVCITGHGFTVETDTEAGMEQYQRKIDTQPPGGWNGTQIHIVHSMLMHKAPRFEMRHTLISQVQTNAKVIISGHEHQGFGIVRRDDGVLFINPGALCRLTAAENEIDRLVQVAVLTINDNGEANAELVPIRSALPGWEVLSREALEQENEKQNRVDRFLELLISDGEEKFLEVREIVLDIAAREGLPDEIKDEALRRIDIAREQLHMNDLGQTLAK